MCMFVHVQVVCSPKPSIKQFGHYVGLLLWVSEGDLVQNMHGSVRTLIYTRCKHSEKTERLTEIQMGKSCIEKKTQLAGRKRGQADKNKEKKRRKENNL